MGGMKPDTVFIHCSATQPEWRAGLGVQNKVQEIRAWHMSAPRNWRDIGYHWIIDRDGAVAAGRPETEQGAHVRGHNQNSLGVCLIGGHGSSETDAFADNYTPAQDEALRRLLWDIEKRHGKMRVRGHNEVAAKACPGFNVARWLARKPARKTPAQSTTVQASIGGAVATVGGALSAIGQLDPVAQVALVAAVVVALGAFGWIMRERLRKWAAGDR
jgi:hypothetical protein